MGEYGFKTKAIHSGQEAEKSTGAIMTPIYATSTYVQTSPGVHAGYEYSRSKNPTRTALETCICELEEGYRGYAFASGLAASNTVLELLPKDAHILAIDDLYGGTFRLFDKVKQLSSGLKVDYIGLEDVENLETFIHENTKMIWIETPTNPLLKLVDLRKIAQVGKQFNLLTVCDNTFATPYIQKPIQLGIDIVVHSATKYLNGHSDIIAGIVVVSELPDIAERLSFLQNAIGSILSPFDSFLLLRGLKTLAIRMEAHTKNALAISEFLEAHPKVNRVLYPGLKTHPQYDLARAQMGLSGGMISFYIQGGLNESKRFLEEMKIISLAESLGGVESLIEHPALMTHASIPKAHREAIGIHDNLVRISVGIEDVDDLIQELDRGLSVI